MKGPNSISTSQHSTSDSSGETHVDRSPKYKQARALKVTALVFYVLSGGAALYGFDHEITFFKILAAVLVVLSLTLAAARSEIQRIDRLSIRYNRWNTEVQRLQDKEEAVAAKSTDGATEFASLWAVTQQRIDLYHDIAVAQAESSFKVGQRATVAGFVAVLGLGVIAALFAKSGTAAVAASVVGVAGAAMSGYVGATFVKAQSEASAQLQQFFLQPVEFSKLLGVERLISQLPEAERATAVQQVIRSVMPLSRASADKPA